MLAAARPSLRATCTASRSAAAGPGRDSGRAPDQRVALRPAGQRDDDPLANLPGGGDAVLFAVALQPVLDAVGQPEQREFSQRREIARTEVVAERCVHLVGRVNVAVRHAAAQGLGGHIDEFDLLGSAHHRIGYGLALRHPGDRFDNVVERFEMLDVDRADHVDAGVEQRLHVLPALRVSGPVDVGMRQLVDQRHLRGPLQDGGEVEFGELCTPIGNRPARHQLEPGQLVGRVGPSMCLDERNDDIGAALGSAVTLVEHRESLADTGRRAQVDAQLASRHRFHLISSRLCSGDRRGAARQSRGSREGMGAVSVVTPNEGGPAWALGYWGWWPQLQNAWTSFRYQGTLVGHVTDSLLVVSACTEEHC